MRVSLGRMFVVLMVVTLVAGGAAGAQAAGPAHGAAFQGRMWSGFAWSGARAYGPFVSPLGQTAERRGTVAITATRHRPKSISSASAFIIPASNLCVRKHELTIALRVLPRVKWLVLKIVVDGRHFATIEGRGLAKPVQLRGLPGGVIVVKIIAIANHGRSVSLTRRYTSCNATSVPVQHRLSVTIAGNGSGSVSGSGIVCPSGCSHSYPAGTKVTLTASPGSGSSFAGWSGGGCGGAGTCTVTMSSDESVTASFASNPPAPGSYSGVSTQGGAVSLYVSNDTTELQDVRATTAMSCDPSMKFDDQLQFASIPIAANGSFSGTATQTGVLESTSAQFTYTFSGQFRGATATGQLREDITFNNGTSFTCTTNIQSWSLTRDTQGTQTNAPAPPGSYSGVTTQGGAMSLYVSNDSTELQDVKATTAESCDPSMKFDDQLQFASIPVAADGSFSATGTQTGVIDSTTAQFTYTFAGHFHGTSSNGIERVAGQLREDITFNNGTSFTCTTNIQSWSLTRDTQGTQTNAPAPPGSYSGVSTQGGAVSFSVSSDGTQLQTVSATTALVCVPSKSFDDHVQFASIPIAADGSFSATATQTGVLSGSPAQFTYTFDGHFHGTSSGGHERVAGELREDITFNNGTSFSCTTNLQSWSATGP